MGKKEEAVWCAGERDLNKTETRYCSQKKTEIGRETERERNKAEAGNRGGR